MARPPNLLGSKGGIGITLYLFAALFGLGLAFALGAKPKDLGGIELKATWTFLLAALAEGGLAYGTYQGLFAPEWAGPLAKLLVLVLVGYGLYQNRHLKSLYLVVLGLGLNTLVILANGGHMPVSLETLKQAGVEGWEEILKNRADAVHTLLGENSRLPFLGDVIALPPLRKAVSPGDLFILGGIAGVLVEGTLRVRRVRLSRRQAALRVLAFLLIVLLLLALRA